MGTTKAQLIIRELVTDDLAWVSARHRSLYFAERGWDDRFGDLVDRILETFRSTQDPRCERGFIAELGGQRVGCAFVVRHFEEELTARLRMLLVEPQARSLGIGNQLLTHCLGFARDSGYQKIALWTEQGLTKARQLYERHGFRLIAEEPVEMFGLRLVSQTFERDL